MQYAMKHSTPSKGLIAYIYSNGADCSNGGISSRAHQVIVTGPGIPEIFSETPECPAVVIDWITFDGETTYHLKPAEPLGQHFMNGGTFIYSSDSRFRALFPHNGAIPFHDRIEEYRR